MKQGIKSRQFFLAAILSLAFSISWAQVGRQFPSEKRVITDKITGTKITVLTTADADDSKIYQTHPQWTFDGKYVIFMSNRGEASQRSKVFAVNVETGIITQLTEGETSAGSLNIARKSAKLYYSRGGRDEPLKLIEMDLGTLLKDSEQGKAKSQVSYEREIATLPDNLRESGGFTLDADETVAYVGVSRLDAKPAEMAGEVKPRIEPIPGGIRAINLKTGAITAVIDVPFRMGHIQANPFKSGEILFCHESGGDTPQRMWFVNADGSGYKPLYKERPDEWISHETWVDANTVYFNVKPHDFYTKITPNVADFRERGEGMFSKDVSLMPTGIFSINIRNDNVEVLASMSKGHGFWHNNGTSDGKWAMGDNFDGEIYLINVKTGEKTLWTTGHQLVFKDTDHDLFHPHASFNPNCKQLLFQSGLLSNGKNYDLMLVDIPTDK